MRKILAALALTLVAVLLPWQVGHEPEALAASAFVVGRAVIRPTTIAAGQTATVETSVQARADGVVRMGGISFIAECGHPPPGRTSAAVRRAKPPVRRRGRTGGRVGCPAPERRPISSSPGMHPRGADRRRHGGDEEGEDGDEEAGGEEGRDQEGRDQEGDGHEAGDREQRGQEARDQVCQGQEARGEAGRAKGRSSPARRASKGC